MPDKSVGPVSAVERVPIEEGFLQDCSATWDHAITRQRSTTSTTILGFQRIGGVTSVVRAGHPWLGTNAQLRGFRIATDPSDRHPQ